MPRRDGTRRCSALQHFQRPEHGAAAVFDADFFEDVQHMALHRRETQVEDRGDVAVAFSLRDPEQHLGISPREAEVLLWVAQGKSNADIGTILGLSLATVKRHMLHIFEKTGLENRSSAVLRALEVLQG